MAKDDYAALRNDKDTEKEYTTEEAIDHIGFGRFQLRAGLVTTLTWIADSMEVNILSILGPLLKCQWQLHDWQVALYSSIVFVSIAIFAPIFGELSDRYGRRRILILVTLVGAYYGILSSFAPIFAWLVILRFFVGMVLGANAVSAVYASEFLPIKNRGMWLTAFTLVAWGFGSMFVVLLAYLLVNTVGWRVWITASSLPLLCACTLVTFSRNTPRFSLVSGNYNEAVETLKMMATTNGTKLPPGRLTTTVVSQTTTPFQDRVKALFSPKYRMITILTVIFGFLAQLCYYGTVMAGTIFVAKTGSASLTGGDSMDEKDTCLLGCNTITQSNLADLSIVATAEIFGSCMGSYLTEKLGRKPVMSIPFYLLAVIILILPAVRHSRTVLVVSLVAARTLCTSSGLVYVYSSEVYPTPFRTTGVAASFLSGRVGAAVSPFISQVLLNKHPWLGAIVLAIASFTAATIAVCLPIETKGQEMED